MQVMTTQSIVVTLVLAILSIALKKKYALLPLFVLVAYVPNGHSIKIAGANFTPLKIIVVFYVIRIIVRREIVKGSSNNFDRALFLWMVLAFILPLLRSTREISVFYQIGFFYSALGLYVTFRSLIGDFHDLENLFRYLAVIITPLAVMMFYEYATGKNLFSYLGGVSITPWFRDQRFRCQGPFRHAILAGTFGATLIPFMWYSYRKNAKNILGLAGLTSATVITVTANSSGPLMTYVFALIGLSIWPLRLYMRYVRWGLFVSLVFLHFYMKAPIWYIIARISDVIGGSGWDRAHLINQSIKYFSEWWIIGTDYTAHWMPFRLPSNPNMADITNQFVAQGVNGGILLLIVFTAVLIKAFSCVGSALKSCSTNGKEMFFVWCGGATLFAHIAAYMSVTYFDQIVVMYYFLLAIISGMGGLIVGENNEGKHI